MKDLIEVNDVNVELVPRMEGEMAMSETDDKDVKTEQTNLNLMKGEMMMNVDEKTEPTNKEGRENMTNSEIVTYEIDGQRYNVDLEFKNMFWAKTAEQHEALKEAIRTEGVRNDLVVWDEEDLLVDGHGRLKICVELDIKPPVHRMSFASREHVKMWIVHNQIIQRNLNVFQRVESVLQFNDFFAAKAKANQSAAGGAVSQICGEPVDTNKELGKLSGTNAEMVRKVKNILKKASQNELEALRRDEVKINSVYTKYVGKKKEDTTLLNPNIIPESESNSIQNDIKNPEESLEQSDSIPTLDQTNEVPLGQSTSNLKTDQTDDGVLKDVSEQPDVLATEGTTDTDLKQMKPSTSDDVSDEPGQSEEALLNEINVRIDALLDGTTIGEGKESIKQLSKRLERISKYLNREGSRIGNDAVIVKDDEFVKATRI